MNKTKEYVNIKNSLFLLLLIILFFISPLFKLIPMLLFHLNNNDPVQKVTLTLISNICLLIILFIIYRKELIKEFKKFKNSFLKNIDVGIKWWLLGLFIMIVSNTLIVIIFRLTGAQNEKSVQQMITSSPIIMLVTAGIIAPMIEEIIFRKGFKNAFPNKYLFIILSSFIFGLLHTISGSSLKELLYIIPYSSLGMSFAIMYYKTDTVFTSITMHILHNTILIILATL